MEIEKRIMGWVIFAVVLLLMPRAEGVDVTFTSSGQIVDGEEWGNVYIYGDDTVVDMSGGNVDSMGAWDASTVDITGGYVSTLDARDSSTVDVSGGFVYGLHALENASISFSGLARAVRVSAGGEYGIANISGGITDYLGVGEYGVMNLYGGTVTENLGAVDDAIVNIYGYGFSYDPTGGSRDGGQLTGYWLDGGGFSVDLYGVETYSHINLVPEPSSIVLLLVGSIGLIRKRRRN